MNTIKNKVRQRALCWWLCALLCAAYAVPRNASAQTTTQWASWGDAATASGDHYGASRFYAHALEGAPGRLDLQWKMAETCRLSNQYDLAVENYEKVVKKDMGRTHPEAMRWLAEMQMCIGDYDAALRTWNKVKQKEKDNASFIERRADNGIAGCKLAKELMAAPEEVTVEHLANGVNTYDSEFGGRIGPDSAFWFTSLRGRVNAEGEVEDTTTYRVAVYRTPINGTFKAPASVVEGALNALGDNANAAWGRDGTFFFTRCGWGWPCVINALRGDSVTHLNGLSVEHNSTQPMIAVIDGSEKLFFTSNRPGGEGGMDIWVGNLDGMTVTDLRPLGPPVNTPGNECCPFYDEVERKLYFSSDFHPGMGGYDNFMSVHADDVFGEPQNFKYPLNSPANDLYPTFDFATMSGFFTSNRVGSLAKKGETCCNDIYRFSHRIEPPLEVVPVDSTILAAVERITSLREKLPVRLYFHNDEPEPRSWDTLTPQTYMQTYLAYKARTPEYHEAWRGDIAGIDAFFMNAVDGGYARLGDFVALLKQALDEGQQVKLVVRGFASPLAKSDYNVNLSLRRIQSLINHLRTIEDGALLSYLDGTAPNGGRLEIEKAPFGEYKAVEGVSDVLEDLKNSVYSVAASLERRIEIEQVEVLDGALLPHAALIDSVIDLGAVEFGMPTQAVFTLRNAGALPLRILKSEPDCGCTHAAIDTSPIPPGGVRTITVDFNGHAPEGAFKRSVKLLTDGDPSTLRLTITGTIVLPK